MKARTYHASWAAIIAKIFCLVSQGSRQADEQLGAAGEAGKFVARTGLEPGFQLLNGQGLEPNLVDLGLVGRVAREESLETRC